MNLYEVTAVNQETGEAYTKLYLAKDLNYLEQEIADIISIKPLHYETL